MIGFWSLGANIPNCLVIINFSLKASNLTVEECLKSCHLVPVGVDVCVGIIGWVKYRCIQ